MRRFGNYSVHTCDATIESCRRRKCELGIISDIQNVFTFAVNYVYRLPCIKKTDKAYVDRLFGDCFYYEVVLPLLYITYHGLIFDVTL